MAEKKLTIRIGASDETARGFSSVEAQLDRLGRSAKNLEQGFGEERGIKKLIQGGIIGYGGDKLAELTNKAVELRDKFREGSMSAGEIGLELAKGIPIIGGFISAGRAIRELITGDEAALKAANAEALALNTASEMRVSILKDQVQWQNQSLEVLRQIRQETERMLASPENQEGTAIEQAKENAIAAAEKQKQTEFDAIKKKADEARDKISKDLGTGALGQSGYNLQRKQIALDEENARIAAFRRAEEAKSAAETLAERKHEAEYKKRLDQEVKDAAEAAKKIAEIKEAEQKKENDRIEQQRQEQHAREMEELDREQAAESRQLDRELEQQKEQQEQYEKETEKKPEINRLAEAVDQRTLTGLAQSAMADPSKDIATNTKDTTAELKKQTRTLTDMLNFIRRGGSGVQFVNVT